MTLYSLKKNEKDAWHIFEGNRTFGIFSPPRECTCESHSICNKMKTDDTGKCKKDEYTCLDEKEARFKCAEMGRIVCGTCVSHLYADFKEE